MLTATVYYVQWCVLLGRRVLLELVDEGGIQKGVHRVDKNVQLGVLV